MALGKAGMLAVLVLPVTLVAAPNASAAGSLKIGDASASEGSGSLTFDVTLSKKAKRSVDARFETVAGSATSGSDFQPLSGKVKIRKGKRADTIDVPVLEDILDEPDETFEVRLSKPSHARISDGTGLGTITDDDAPATGPDEPTSPPPDEPTPPAPPQVSIADATPVTEGNSGTTSASFTVSLSAPSDQQVTVDYQTQNDTAIAPGDYTAASGTVTFAPQDTSEQIIVSVNGDATDEPDETFDVDLASPQLATMADGHATATITDDDPAPTISIADATTVTEGNSGTTSASFTVSLSGPSSQQISVDYATANATAQAPGDYTAASGTVTFAPLDTSEPILVDVKGDVTDEPDETFDVDLANPHQATIADGQASATITDDDPTPAISIADATPVLEGDSGTATASFTVSLSGPSSQQITVDYVTGNATAVAPGDYTAASGTVTFVPLDTSEQILVDVKGDVTEEDTEGFVVNLSNPQQATITDGQASAAITDDDPDALNETGLPAEADFCDVHPSQIVATPGGSTGQIVGQVFESGVTGPGGPHASVSAQVGIGPAGSDPRTADGWSFTTAAYNRQIGNNDEYVATRVAPAAGSYSYTYRFSFDGGQSYTYCDVNGAGSNGGNTFETAQLGVLTVD